MLSVFSILFIANVLADNYGFQSTVDKIYGDKLACAQDSGKMEDYLDNFAINVDYCSSIEQYNNNNCDDKDGMIESITTNWIGEYSSYMNEACLLIDEDAYSRSAVVECDVTLTTEKGCKVKSISYDICTQIRSKY